MTSRRRLGVMGGTFDPPHLGHLAAASEAHTRLDLDAVVFVPAGNPWQKADRTLTPADHRLAMTRLATQDDPRFVISEVDLRRPGATYTVDTLADLRAEQGDDTDFFLLLGADALSGFATWHRAHDIARECTLVGITRPGTELRAPGPPAEEVILLTMPGTSISSTECRERFAADVPNIYLVPDSVIAYAQAHALYGGAR